MNRKYALVGWIVAMVILGSVALVLIAPWVTSAPEPGVYVDGIKLKPANRPVSIGSSYHNAVAGREWNVTVNESLESSDLIVGGFELGNPRPLYAMRVEPVSAAGSLTHYRVSLADRSLTRFVLMAIRTTSGPKHFVLFVMDEENVQRRGDG